METSSLSASIAWDTWDWCTSGGTSSAPSWVSGSSCVDCVSRIVSGKVSYRQICKKINRGVTFSADQSWISAFFLHQCLERTLSVTGNEGTQNQHLMRLFKLGVLHLLHPLHPLDPTPASQLKTRCVWATNFQNEFRIPQLQNLR